MNIKIYICILIVSCLVCSCNKQDKILDTDKINRIVTNDISVNPNPWNYASEHSEALDFFLNNASIDKKYSNFSHTEDPGDITKTYISSVLDSFNFSRFPSFEKKVDINKLKAYIDYYFPIICSDLSSYSAIQSKIDYYLFDNNNLSIEYRFHTQLAFLIFLDSYDYWIENNGLYKWVHKIYRTEDKKTIYKILNIPEAISSDPVKHSPGDRMIWSDIAKRDAQNGGFVFKVSKNDLYGFFTALWAGPFSASIGYTAASIGAASGLLD